MEVLFVDVGTHCSCWKAELFCGLEMGALDAIVRQGHCEHIITPGDESQTIGYWAVHIAAGKWRLSDYLPLPHSPTCQSPFSFLLPDCLCYIELSFGTTTERQNLCLRIDTT